METLMKRIGNEYTNLNFYKNDKNRDCVLIEATFGQIDGEFSWSPEGIDFYNFELTDEEGHILDIKYIDIDDTKVADKIEEYHNDENNKLY
jgi:hypothetical protein